MPCHGAAPPISSQDARPDELDEAGGRYSGELTDRSSGEEKAMEIVGLAANACGWCHRTGRITSKTRSPG